MHPQPERVRYWHDAHQWQVRADPAQYTLATFSSSSALKVSYAKQHSSGSGHTEERVTITDLSQGSADGWTTALSSMVGTGYAIHMRAENFSCCSRESLSVNKPRTLTIKSSMSTFGQCMVLLPTDKPSHSLASYVSFFKWTNATATHQVCSTGGSVQLERFLDIQGADRVKITANVQFSDGTVWQDKEFFADYVEY